METTTDTNTRNLIVTVVHDDTYVNGELVAQGYSEDIAAGPATAEQIAASDANVGENGFIQIDEDGDVIPTGGFHAGALRTAYVEV